MNSHLFTNRSRQISFLLLIFVGFMLLSGYTQAAGGGGVGIEVHIKDGLETQAIWVGLAILFGVYALMIFEWVHRAMAPPLRGLPAVRALD